MSAARKEAYKLLDEQLSVCPNFFLNNKLIYLREDNE